jgi:hypothetical protein
VFHGSCLVFSVSVNVDMQLTGYAANESDTPCKKFARQKSEVFQASQRNACMGKDRLCMAIPSQYSCSDCPYSSGELFSSSSRFLWIRGITTLYRRRGGVFGSCRAKATVSNHRRPDYLVNSQHRKSNPVRRQVASIYCLERRICGLFSRRISEVTCIHDDY